MTTVRKVTYLDPDEDGVVLEWLTSQRNEASAIRQALWAHITEPAEERASHAVCGERELQAALERALKTTTLRQLIEAAVTTALQQLAVVLPTAGEPDGDRLDDDLTDSFLIE